MPQGEIISQVQKFEPATLFGEVAKATGVTYAQKYGRYLEFIAIFGSMGLLLLRRKGSR